MIPLKNISHRAIERSLIFLVLAAMFSSIVINTRLGLQRNATTLRQLDKGWYRYVGGQFYNVNIPGRVTVPDGEDLVICYDGLKNEEGSRTIFTKGAVYRIRMDIGDHTIYEYDDREFRRNRQMRSKLDCTAILPENPAGQTLTFTYRNDGSNEFHLKPVYLGRSGEAMRKIWYDNLAQMLGIFAMSVIGVICFCAHLYLRYMHVEDSRMGSAALFMLLGSMWCLLDSSVVQQIQVAASKMSVLSIYAFMALPIPVIHFVQSTGDLRKYKILQNILYLAYGNILLQALLHITLRIPYASMVPVTQIFHSFVCGSMHYLLYKVHKAKPDFENTVVLQCVTILALAGIVELALYWVFPTSFYGLALELGVLAFIIRILCAILTSMTSNLHFKNEAIIYRNMSREDRLTGLTNRRAFDETLSELEQHAHRYHDVALFFMDVNGLKVVNDKFGHPAGDELIISAAKALSAAFSEDGTCYRLGGDEFAALLLNPQLTREQWKEKIDAAVAEQNLTCSHPLSVSWGVSYQRDQNRNVKHSADWLHQADQAMYEMKLKMKATREDLLEANT